MTMISDIDRKFMMRKTTYTFFLMILISSCSKGYIPVEETSPIQTGPISYQTHISPIISSRCISCHSGSNPNGNLNLENYNQVRNASENGLLIQRINDAANPMPTSGLMSASTRALFDEWVSGGFIEN